MSEVTLLHAYQSSPIVLEGTVFAALPLPLMVFAEPLGVALLTSGADLARLSHQSRRARRRSLKTASYSCVKLPASGEVGVIWLRFRSALAVNLHPLATPHTSGSPR